MASSSDYQASSLDESEYLDAMPLHLSDQGAADDLDGFDFILDDVDEDSAAGSSAEIFDALLSNSTNSGGSSNDMHFDSIQEHLDGFDPTPVAPKPSRRRGKRERSASPQANRQFQMNGINFDPPARRQASHGDLSMMSMSSVQQGNNNNNTSHSHHEATTNNRPAGISKSQYTEALRKLAMSMKQTQESREHVCKMKREYLTPAQQAALAKAKEELQKQNEAIQKVASSTSAAAAHAQVTASPVTPPQAGSSLMTAFFTGTQQSRKHLGNYMDLTNTL